MSLVHAVELAMKQGRTFSPEQSEDCPHFDSFLRQCPQIFAQVDETLFDGALGSFLRINKIKFEIVASKTGPAGLTTYSENPSCMRVALNRNAWQTTLPAFVGGNLCDTSAGCIRDVFLHELVHVLLFSIYLQIEMSPEEVERLIPYRYDPTHNILFTTWLSHFFGQHTINNSLLLCGTHEPLTFDRDMRETEYVCVHDPKNAKTVTIFRNGKKERATIVASNTFYAESTSKLKPHHSHVRTRSGTLITVPNGLIFC